MAKEMNYINNPLRIAVDGTKLLFQKAPMTAIVLAFLSAISASGYFVDSSKSAKDATLPQGMTFDAATTIGIVVGVLIFAFGMLVIGSFLSGIFAHTAAEIAKGREVTFRQSLAAISGRFWSFVWLQLLIAIKIILWSLLFIIPGVIMAIRYSLANLSFFDDKKMLKGNAAIKDSLLLTKDAWITTFATQAVFNIITLGMISPIIDTGAKAMLYRQFNDLQKTGAQKPSPHTLSWVLLGAVVFMISIALLIGAVAAFMSIAF